MKRFFLLIILLASLALGNLGFSQGDDVVFDETSRILTYQIDFERLVVNAEARECPTAAFESGVLHGVLRHLFLFLPFEATYYNNVETVEVRVLKDEDLVIYASAPLEAIRSTNKRFRVFMNSFASPRAGLCFAIGNNNLELWVSTLEARAGTLAYDPAEFTTSIPGAITVAELAESSSVVAAPVESVSQPEPTEVVEAEASIENAAANNTDEATDEPVTEVTNETEASVVEAPQVSNNEFLETAYLSRLPTRSFTEPSIVLEPSKDYAALIETTKGQLFVDLFEEAAPNTVNNFVFLALNKYYEGLSFHRVLEDFMAQTGDPTGSGSGGPGYQIPDEIVEGFSHSSPGILSMANAGPNTAGSQFFITFAPTPWLDGQFSIFGAVLDGLDVLAELQINDPSQPLAIATPDTTLGLLELQGVSLEGADSLTFEEFLIEAFGFVPPVAQRLSIGEFDFMIITDPQTENRLVSFWPRSDKVTSITIVERNK